MKKILLVLGVLSALVFSLCLGGCGSSGGTSVAAPTGTYTGQSNDGIVEFKGIRYGNFEPFQAATDVETTTDDNIDATEFKENCIQPYDEVEVASQDECSQDCLFLNIWTKDVDTTDKPVIVFIHGGSYIWGGTTDPSYDGQYFVRNLPDDEDCVFITINYRLSFMGGCDMSTLDGYTDKYADATNLSKLDQIQALKWVNENIEAWGGDKNNVTIMGQSSGGAAVHMLAVDESTHKYYQRAIIDSGHQTRECVSDQLFKEHSKKIFDVLGVDSVDELVALTDKEISDKMIDINDAVDSGERPADGNVISETWWEDWENGAAKDIDLLLGCTNGEEDWLSVDWDNSISEPITDDKSLYEELKDREDSHAGTYGRLFALDEEGFYDAYLAMGDDEVLQAQNLYNDLKTMYPMELLAEQQSEYNANTYMYYWEYAPDMDEVLDYSGDSAEVSPWNRAMHCMDLCFALGTKDGYTELTGDPEKMSDDLIAQMQSAIYNFASTGDPNNDLISNWKAFTADKKDIMVVDADGKWKCNSDYNSESIDKLREIKPYGVK